MTAPAVAPAAPTIETPAVIPAAVAPVVAPPTPPAEPAAPKGPLSRREVKAQMAQERRTSEEAAPAASEPSVTTEAAPTDGQPPAAPVGTEPATPAADPAKPAEPAPVAEAPKPIRVPIAADHPALRENQKLEAVTVQTPEEEYFVRTLLNGHVRKKQLEEVQTRLHQAEVQIAERDARDAAEVRWSKDPRYNEAVQTYRELVESSGQEVADRYWDGVAQNLLVPIQNEERTTRMDAIESRRLNEAGTAWIGEAWGRASGLPDAIRSLPEFKSVFDTAIESFNDGLARNHFPDLKPGDPEGALRVFAKFFSERLIRHPAVIALSAAQQAALKTQSTSAADKAAEEARRVQVIKDAAVAEYLKGVADKRQLAPPHPLGSLPTAARAAPTDDVAADNQPAADKSITQIKREAKQGAREDARRRFTGASLT